MKMAGITDRMTAKERKADVFSSAKSWAEDRFAMNERSRARYQAAFLGSLSLNVLAIIAVFTLANLHTLVPLIVHHYDNGVTVVEPGHQKEAPVNRAQVESDIVRYVQNRESWDIASYRYQFDLVKLLSSNTVAREYVAIQQARNPNSPVKKLGERFSRKVHVYSVNFLDNVIKNQKDLHKNHSNLAEVVFSLTDTDKSTGNAISQTWSALVAWQYVKPSESPEERWNNFDGFMVTSYSIQPRNQPDNRE